MVVMMVMCDEWGGVGVDQGEGNKFSCCDLICAQTAHIPQTDATWQQMPTQS